MNLTKTLLTILLAITIVSCSSAPTNMTVTPEATVTSAPTATMTPIPAEEIPIALKPGKAETLSPEQQAYIDSEWGKAQQDWLAKWVGYWTTAQKSQRVFSPETQDGGIANAHFKVMQDPKSPKSMTIVLESPDYPDMVILAPASTVKERQDPPEAANPNHEIPDGNTPLFLGTTSGDELAKLGIPQGANLIFTNDEFMMANSSGKIVGVMNFKTRQWENADNIRNLFKLARTSKEANVCRVTKTDLDSGRFRLFAKIMDESSFPEDVKVSQLWESPKVKTQPGNMTWARAMSGADVSYEFYKANLDKRPFRTVVYCAIDNRELYSGDGFDWDLRFVKFIDQSGVIRFLPMISTWGTSDTADANFPSIITVGGDQNKYGSGWRYPDEGVNTERLDLLWQWINTGVIPPRLEELWFMEFS